jgi:hypothetical protein
VREAGAGQQFIPNVLEPLGDLLGDGLEFETTLRSWPRAVTPSRYAKGGAEQDGDHRSALVASRPRAGCTSHAFGIVASQSSGAALRIATFNPAWAGGDHQLRPVQAAAFDVA